MGKLSSVFVSHNWLLAISIRTYRSTDEQSTISYQRSEQYQQHVIILRANNPSTYLHSLILLENVTTIHQVASITFFSHFPYYSSVTRRTKIEFGIFIKIQSGPGQIIQIDSQFYLKSILPRKTCQNTIRGDVGTFLIRPLSFVPAFCLRLPRRSRVTGQGWQQPTPTHLAHATDKKYIFTVMKTCYTY